MTGGVCSNPEPARSVAPESPVLATASSTIAPTLPESRQPNPRQLLSVAELTVLNQRSNWRGFGQLTGHLLIMVVSGLLWSVALGHLSLSGMAWVASLALFVYGFSLAAMFAPLHETVHRTAFASQRLNDAVAWVAGLLSFYNSAFFRRYHKWHHRYTQIPGKDPELNDPKPTTWADYWLQLSGLEWWWGKLRTHSQVALGQLADYNFLADSAQAEVVRSTRWQLLTYGGIIALSTALGHPWFLLLYWLLPLAIGQPILRYVLLAEHSGCTLDDNPLTNTRTTLTLAPLRFLMWNMPFHAEHHLYPSVPFHALPQAHHHLKPHLAHLTPGYMAGHRQIMATLGKPVP